MNKILGCLVLIAVTSSVFAQSGTNSPYSQYGFGDLCDQSVGFNKGMNGIGLGWRGGTDINPLNPASYSAVDSLSMIFDAGLSGQTVSYEENDKKQKGKSGGFDYVVGMFRAFKNVGVTFGMLPYSNIGYSYSSTTRLPVAQTSVISTYSGDGGLHQLFLGAGWKVVKNLSVGFNFSYLWGEYKREISTSSSSAINSLSKKYNASIDNYKLDIGLQYEVPFNKLDVMTVGATFSPGHSLNSSPECLIISKNSTISKSDSTVFSLSEGLALPTSFGIGVGYSHANKLKLGADFLMQKWGSVEFPDYDGSTYAMKKGLLKDSYRLNVGAEWTPRYMSRNFFQRIHYRVGVGYTTPYYYINGQDGPKEFSASIGFGFPIINSYNGRSVLNISAQWVNRSADNLIKENMLRLNIGLTFNERWFAKWKVE